MQPEITLSIGELAMILGGLTTLIGAVVTLAAYLTRQQVKTAILEAMQSVQGEMCQYVTKEACKGIREDCRRLHEHEMAALAHLPAKAPHRG